jgi:UDP-N-acetyl-D-mannosaminuronate dehydrogenase
MRIKIIGNTYIGLTAGVKVTAEPLKQINGYNVLGIDLINAGVIHNIDGDSAYYIHKRAVKEIRPKQEIGEITLLKPKFIKANPPNFRLDVFKIHVANDLMKQDTETLVRLILSNTRINTFADLDYFQSQLDNLNII